MKCPHRLMGLHDWSQAVDAIWGGYGTFSWWDFDEGITLLGAGFEAFKPCPNPSPFPMCGLNAFASPIFLLLCFPCHEHWNRHPNPFSLSSLTTETESDWCILQNCSSNLAFSFCGTITVRSLFAFSAIQGLVLTLGSVGFSYSPSCIEFQTGIIRSIQGTS